MPPRTPALRVRTSPSNRQAWAAAASNAPNPASAAAAAVARDEDRSLERPEAWEQEMVAEAAEYKQQLLLT